ncbi:hypothetical protein QEG98_18885 [Myxococcus sp. MxC21-1]|uniref:hypothetical protein n=1 Tax=Myxococcus sp. MxC21-1 TaxID=3041439 RepID=UPI002930A47B|nr:hypothetical protein [Myxococcus sp. MxC21-1]WNZ65500.1 hypothetical protein QEG98_18885 [Myxococcus sp. MxC21-1]
MPPRCPCDARPARRHPAPTLLGEDAVRFARDGQRRGADVLEIRTDLHAPDAISPEALAAVLPLLVSERGKPLPAPGWPRPGAWTGT